MLDGVSCNCCGLCYSDSAFCLSHFNPAVVLFRGLCLSCQPLCPDSRCNPADARHPSTVMSISTHMLTDKVKGSAQACVGLPIALHGSCWSCQEDARTDMLQQGARRHGDRLQLLGAISCAAGVTPPAPHCPHHQIAAASQEPQT